MNESGWNPFDLIPNWVAATQHLDIPLEPDGEQLNKGAVELLRRLRDGTWEDFSLDSDDRGLAVLSRICFELSGDYPADLGTLRQATNACELVSRLDWPVDHFGEKNEILCQLALVAWTHSRTLGPTDVTLEWERKYREAFSRPSVLRAQLEEFLATESSERLEGWAGTIISDIESLTGLCELLRLQGDIYPANTAANAAALYDLLVMTSDDKVANEKAYFLAKLASLAGSCSRFLGRREVASEWFAKAESHLTVSGKPGIELARVAYGRLTLLYERRQFDVVLESVPRLLQQFQVLKMEDEQSLCLFLEAMALKESGSTRFSVVKFLELAKRLSVSDPRRLLCSVLTKLGDLYSTFGWHQKAMQQFQRALPLVLASGRSCTSPDLKGSVAEACRNMGQLHTAIDLFREACSEYAALGMVSLAAYVRIVLAETLLLAGRPREAEIEILAAIPTIEKEGMVEEGFAALNLLRTSVHQCETDVTSLRALRERLRGYRK